MTSYHCHKPAISSAKLKNTINRNETMSRTPNSSYKISTCAQYVCYLERSKGELSKKLHKAQHPSGMFISNKGKDDLMGSQQWDQRQGRLGQPRITKEKETKPPNSSLLCF